MACFVAYVESNFQMQFKEHMNLCNIQVRFVSSIEWWCKVQSATIEWLESNDRKTWIKCLDTCFLSLNLICCVYNSALDIGAFLLLTDGGDTLQSTRINQDFIQSPMDSCDHVYLPAKLRMFLIAYSITDLDSLFFQALNVWVMDNIWTLFLPQPIYLPGHMNCGQNIILCLQIIVVSHDAENSLWLVESLNKCEPLSQTRDVVTFVNFLRQNDARGTLYAGLAQENRFGSA
jgi:hypothetical protein